jgi:hypothetical protein
MGVLPNQRGAPCVGAVVADFPFATFTLGSRAEVVRRFLRSKEKLIFISRQVPHALKLAYDA